MIEQLTLTEYAKRRGVNKSTISRWIQNGRMTTLPNGKINPAIADRELDATESPLPHHQARKAVWDDHKATQAQESAHSAPQDAQQATPAQQPTPSLEKLGAALKLETYKLQKAKAEQANMELDKMAGALVERSEVDYILADFGNTLRALLESLPDRLTAAVAANRGDAAGIHKTLADAARELLTEMADHMQRKTQHTLGR